MVVTAVKLLYEGTDSPRGKCYFAAWSDPSDGFGFVGWGPGDQPTQFTRYLPRHVQRKLVEKVRKGYRETDRYEVQLDDDFDFSVATDEEVCRRLGGAL